MNRTSNHFRQSSFRPRLETLEDRSVPAILTVTTTLDVVDPNDGLLSLREAVQEANACPGVDRVDVPAGTFLLSAGWLTLDGQLSLIGSGAGSTILDGLQKPGRVIHAFGDNITIAGLTIQNGGGGGLATEGKVSILDCVIAHNGTPAHMNSSGGGIANGGTLTIKRSIISDNASIFNGGGVYDASRSLTIVDSVIANNRSRLGGGIHLHGDGPFASATIVRCAITDNVAVNRGGGIFTENQQTTVADCILSGNFANYGGGLYAGGYETTVRNSSLVGNSANFGGALFNARGSLIVLASTLAGNSAVFGGAIANGTAMFTPGTVTVIQSTITGNSATESGGGIANYGTLSVRDSTVTGNSAPLGGDLFNAGFADIYDSIIGDWYEV